MSTGETVAVKVLATDSKQGEREFQTEVEVIHVNALLSWHVATETALTCLALTLADMLHSCYLVDML